MGRKNFWEKKYNNSGKLFLWEITPISPDIFWQKFRFWPN